VIITIIDAENSGSANAFAAAEPGHDASVLETTSGMGLEDPFETLCQERRMLRIDHIVSGKCSDSLHVGKESCQKLNMVIRGPKEALETAEIMRFLHQAYKYLFTLYLVKWTNNKQRRNQCF